jgi:hypothetical protein
MDAFLDGSLDSEGHAITFREREFKGKMKQWLVIDGEALPHCGREVRVDRAG